MLSDMHFLSVVCSVARPVDGTTTEVEMWAGTVQSDGGAEEPAPAASSSAHADGRHFALVCVKRVPLRDRRRLEHEAQWMRTCAAILEGQQARLYGFCVDAQCALLMTEFLPLGDVFNWKASDFPSGAPFWTRSATRALAVLHARHIAHTDISAENMACRADGSCVLLDFEHLRFETRLVDPATLPTKPRYRAPEMLDALPVSATRADLFALGVVCLMIILGPAHSGVKNGPIHEGLAATSDRAKRTAEIMSALGAVGSWTARAVVPLLALVPKCREAVYADEVRSASKRTRSSRD